jgi:hypothetical protein
MAMQPRENQSVETVEEEPAEVDVDNDPGNEDPGSQFDRDATVPLIESEE